MNHRESTISNGNEQDWLKLSEIVLFNDSATFFRMGHFHYKKSHTLCSTRLYILIQRFENPELRLPSLFPIWINKPVFYQIIANIFQSLDSKWGKRQLRRNALVRLFFPHFLRHPSFSSLSSFHFAILPKKSLWSFWPSFPSLDLQVGCWILLFLFSLLGAP